MTTIDSFIHSLLNMNNKSKEYFSRIGEVTSIAIMAARALAQIYVAKLALIMSALEALMIINKKMRSMDATRFIYTPQPLPLTFRRGRKEPYSSALEKLNISFLLNIAFVEKEISKSVSKFEERMGEFRFILGEDTIRMVQGFTPLPKAKATPLSLVPKRAAAEVSKASLPSTQEYARPPPPAFREKQRQVEKVPEIVQTFAISDQMKPTLEATLKRYGMALPTRISEVQQLPAFIEEKTVLADLAKLESSLSGISTTGIWRHAFAGIPEISGAHKVISSIIAGISYAPYGIPQTLRLYDASMLFISRIRETFKVYGMGDQLKRVLESYSMPTTMMREAVAPPTLYPPKAAEEMSPALLPELRPLALGIDTIGGMVTKAESIQIYQALVPPLISALGTEITALRPEKPARQIFPLDMWVGSALGLRTLRLPRMISEAIPKMIPKPIVREEKTLMHEEILPWTIHKRAWTAYPIALGFAESLTHIALEAQKYVSPSTVRIARAPELTTLRKPRMISEEAMKTIPMPTLAQATLSVQRMAFAGRIVGAFDLFKINKIGEAEIVPRPFVRLLTKLREDRVDLGRLAFKDISKIPSSIQILTPPTIAPTHQPIGIPKALAPSSIAQIQPSILEPALIREQVRAIQNTFNITVQAASLGDGRDLRELRRKIEQILAEEARRYFGSTMM